MVEASAGTGAPSCRGGVVGPAARRCCGGAGCGLGRLVRRLRRQGRQALCAASRPPSASAEALRGCQYDPLSYARNFDHTGFGDPDASSLYYSYTFSSRFVLAPGTTTSSTAVAVAVAVAPPAGIVTAVRPTAASH